MIQKSGRNVLRKVCTVAKIKPRKGLNKYITDTLVENIKFFNNLSFLNC